MKLTIYCILTFMLNALFTTAQKKLNYSADFEDNTTIEYSIPENNPYTYPNLIINVGLGFLTNPLVPNDITYQLNLSYQLPKIGSINAFVSRATGNTEGDLAFNSRSDNPKINEYTEVGVGITIDIFNKIFPKKKKLHLQTNGNKYHENQYFTFHDFLINNRLGIDFGYFRTIGLITNFNKTKQRFHLTSDKGETLVPQNHPLLLDTEDNAYYIEPESGLVHSTLQTDLLYLGALFESSYKLRVITDNEGSGRLTASKWGVYGHFIYSPNMVIDPVTFKTKRPIADSRSSHTKYTHSIPKGTYNVQHDGSGGFQTIPWGFRVGTFTRIAFSKAFGILLKVETGMLPGIKSYDRKRGLFIGLGRAYISASLALSFGIHAPKFPADYKL